MIATAGSQWRETSLPSWSASTASVILDTIALMGCPKDRQVARLGLCIFLGVAISSGCDLHWSRPLSGGSFDLTSFNFTVTPPEIHVGDRVGFTYTIINLGKSIVPAKTYDVELYVDGKLVAFDRATSPIGPGQQNRYVNPIGTWDSGTGPPRSVSYRLVIDPDNRILETDESNNVIIGSFEVKKRPAGPTTPPPASERSSKPP